MIVCHINLATEQLDQSKMFSFASQKHDVNTKKDERYLRKNNFFQHQNYISNLSCTSYISALNKIISSIRNEMNLSALNFTISFMSGFSSC